MCLTWRNVAGFKMYYFEDNLNTDLGLVNALESMLLTILLIIFYKAGDLEHHHLLIQDYFIFIV